jgi:Tfp pilus assembly protein FimT
VREKTTKFGVARNAQAENCSATQSANRSVNRAECGTRRGRLKVAGFTLAEMMIMIAMGLVILIMAFPHIDSAVHAAQLNGAVSSATWAIQSTRYQAIMKGYPYQLAFTTSNNSYQISSDSTWPGATTFTNIGTAVPLTSSAVTLSANTTFQFSGNGSVSATVGNMNFQISYQGVTHTITVSNYGSITVQ